MRRLGGLLLVLLLWPSLLWAAPSLSERDWIALKALARNGGGGVSSGSGLPVTCTPGTGPNALFLDTDTGFIYYCSATDTFTLLLTTVAEADTLDTVFDRGKAIDGANSVANAVRIGDGTTPMCLYTDATLGPVIKPCTDANTRTPIWSGFTWCLYGIAPDSCLYTVTPGAATSLLKYTYQSGHRPLASVYIGAESMHGDGTNCPSNPTKVDVFNQPRYTFICTENNGSRLKGVIPMRNNWDAGVIFIKPHYMQTAADTGSVNLEVAAACRAFGVAFDGAYGTEIEVDDAALVGSGAIEATLSAAVTPNGTCAAGDLLYFYIDVDATDNPTTAAATLHLLGADVFWSITSPSH